MVLRPRLLDDAKEMEDKILCFLHHRYAHSENIFFLVDELREYLPIPKLGAFKLAIEGAGRSRFFDAHPINENGEVEIGYSISREGIAYVESWPDERYEGISEGIQFLDAEGIPASDRTVTLNHNQPEYQDTVAALDKVVEAFRDDHRLDNELGHEKGALLKALEAGRELLNDTVVNVRIGTALLIEPLQRLVVKYEKELVAALASAAIPLILKVFGVS